MKFLKEKVENGLFDCVSVRKKLKSIQSMSRAWFIQVLLQSLIFSRSLISLRQFDQLHTVILDHNALDEHFCFPGKFPAIKLLSVNGNKIANLSVFVNRMSQDLPNLTFLSMMKNDAAPSYFNGGTKSQNEDYRSYVISHFPKLRNLDGWPILDGEREQAYRLYGKRWKIKKRTASSYTWTYPMFLFSRPNSYIIY